MSIVDAELFSRPLAVVDLETTGLTPGQDRIVEACVIRMDPSSETPYFRAFDSLVRPHRKIFHTHVHGIEAEQAYEAPSFEDIAKRLYDALEGAILVAHNALFDVRFLQAEFMNVDVDFKPPYLCTRSLPAALGLASESTNLEALCQQFGIAMSTHHIARNDARAAAMLVGWLRQMLVQKGVRTFGDIPRISVGGWYRFFDSFENDVPGPEAKRSMRTSVKPLVPRVDGGNEPGSPTPHDGVAEANQETYTSALLEAVSDFQLSRKQLDRLIMLQRTNGLSEGQIRAVHAQVFSYVLSEYTHDDVLDDGERHRLQLLFECLTTLGWAPGI